MRFVAAESKRIHLENGDWIEVKKELSVGEDKRYRMRGLRGMSGLAAKKEDEMKVDVEWEILPIARVEAYLVAWSDKRPVTRDAIEALASEDFEAIDSAIIKHIDEMASEKKALANTNEGK
jgi:hypothetical protein